MIKINVDEVLKIEPQNEPRKQSSINIDAVINTHQAEKLFYKLWDAYGNDVLNEWLKNEGCELLINKPK